MAFVGNITHSWDFGIYSRRGFLKMNVLGKQLWKAILIVTREPHPLRTIPMVGEPLILGCNSGGPGLFNKGA